VNHLIKYYNDSFLAACETQRVPVIKPMTTTEFQAMRCTGKESRTGESELKKHLSSHLGTGFCPTRRSVNIFLRATALFIMEAVNLPLKETIRQNLLSGTVILEGGKPTAQTMRTHVW
jgi:hypothetical protein